MAHSLIFQCSAGRCTAPRISSHSHIHTPHTHTHTSSFADWNVALFYLASSCVELQRSQVGVKDHVTGLDVDGRLSLSYGAEVPGRVDQTPEGRDCGRRDEAGREQERRKRTALISTWGVFPMLCKGQSVRTRGLQKREDSDFEMLSPQWNHI